MFRPQGRANPFFIRKMREILAKPGFIAGSDASNLKNLHNQATLDFSSMGALSDLGAACYTGLLDVVMREFGTRDLDGTESDFELGYATIVVLGSQRVRRVNSSCQDCLQSRCAIHDTSTEHEACLNFLLSRGVPPDLPDLCGYTALHHSLIGILRPAISRVLLEHGADVNAQNRYGITPLLVALDLNDLELVEMFLQAGAKLDLKDGEGTSPEVLYRTRKPEIVQAVEMCIRERVGNDAALKGDRCSVCKRRGIPLKRCARCRIKMYCSVECQKNDWKDHKPTCTPPDHRNIVTLKPTYPDMGPGFEPFTVSFNGPALVPGGFGSSVHDGKNMIIKIQLPLEGTADLLVYNEKRTFKCVVDRRSNPAGYDRIESIIKEKGVYGAKGYFAAELKSKDALVVKVGELSDEHRF